MQPDPFADFPDCKNTQTARAMLDACIQSNPECRQDVIVAALRHWLQTIQLVDEARAMAEKLTDHAGLVLAEQKGVTQAIIALAMRRN